MSNVTVHTLADDQENGQSRALMRESDSSTFSTPMGSPESTHSSSTASLGSEHALIELFADRVLSPSDPPSRGEYDFMVTSPPVGRQLPLVPTPMGQFVGPVPPRSNNIIVIYPSQNTPIPEKKKEERVNEVSELLIRRLNARIGRASDKMQGLNLIQKMRRMSGLEPLLSGEELDIPSARLGLCMLAGLRDQKNKMYALDSLLAVLKEDRYHRGTAVLLVSLAIRLMRQMDRALMQAETLDVQIKIAEVYNILAENLHHHFGKRHINAITMELKNQLVETAKALEKLNRLEDTKLKFHVNCALEGVRRLIDDRQELFILCERIYHAAAAAAAMYLQDSQVIFPQLELILKGIDVHLPQAWFNAGVIMKRLAREGKRDMGELAAAQMLMGKKMHKVNWKFTYASVLALYDVCMHGETPEIRFRAFKGIKAFGNDFPGLEAFATCSTLPKYKDMKAIKHLQRPHTIDPNPRIRQAAVECLIDLAHHAPDPEIREKASYLLDKCSERETDDDVLQLLHRRKGGLQLNDSIDF